MCVVALWREQVDLCPVFVGLLLEKSVRDHPLKIFDEAWIVQTKSHLQIRLFQMTVVVEYVQESGEDIQVGTLQA
jgi:hypothetical protein